MSPNEYQGLAARTECDQEAASRRHFQFDKAQGLLATRLSHAVLGLTGEAGELAYAIEKWLYYGKPLDITNIKEEIGDCLWYLALACNAAGLDLEQVMQVNIVKLQVRYPEKYNDLLADEVARNREEERRVIEDGGYASSEVKPVSETEDPQHEQLTADYPTICVDCRFVAIHKTNTSGRCPDCMASYKATLNNRKNKE